MGHSGTDVIKSDALKGGMDSCRRLRHLLSGAHRYIQFHISSVQRVNNSSTDIKIAHVKAGFSSPSQGLQRSHAALFTA